MTEVFLPPDSISVILCDATSAMQINNSGVEFPLDNELTPSYAKFMANNWTVFAPKRALGVLDLDRPSCLFLNNLPRTRQLSWEESTYGLAAYVCYY